FRHARLATWWGWCHFHDGTFTRKIDAAYLGALSNLNINASSDFLNDFEWQLQRLALFIEMVEGFSVSLRDFQEALNIILKEAKARK
ncbi:MAG: hypothetical protein KBD90_02625, partial [Alphaproteobacteria bacterium]|nr:hypothetical protein [Alphaproteobacteria bacterium]